MIRIALIVVLSIPIMARTQLNPSLHPFSGVNATATTSRFEKSGARPAGPQADVQSFLAPSGSVIKRKKPTFHLAQTDLGIPDVQDVIFFTDTRAVRLRLHLKIAASSIQAGWYAQLRKYFDFLDRDSDGVLNAFEADFVFSNKTMQQMIQMGGTFPTLAGDGRPLADLDNDGKISFDEFAAFYAKSVGQLLRVQPARSADQYADKLSDELFKLFDRDRDGKLSKSELLSAARLLEVLDQNEDECLSALECVPNLFSQQTSVMLVKQPAALAPSDPKDTLQIYAPHSIPDSVIEQILLRYDADKNLRLDKVESGLDEESFVKLDKNGDGELSVTELLAWKDLPPDIVLEVTFAAMAADCSVKVVYGPVAKSDVVIEIANGKAVVRVRGQQIDVAALASMDGTANVGTFQAVFNQADTAKKGFLTEKDIQGPQFQYLRILFDLIDRNGDGRIMLKEYNDFFTLRQSFVNVPFVVTYSMQPTNLFGLLDTNGDGRLSVRELRASWDRLKKLDPGSGEFITRNAIKPQASVRYVRGVQALQPLNPVNYNPNVQPTARGPLWYRKMDRNNDGDISRSEFPGRPEDFDKIDLDHDGLISLEEAEAAEKQFRTTKPEKK